MEKQIHKKYSAIYFVSFKRLNTTNGAHKWNQLSIFISNLKYKLFSFRAETKTSVPDSLLFSSYVSIYCKCKKYGEDHSVRVLFRIVCLKLFHVYNFQFESIFPVVSTIFMISTKSKKKKISYANTRKMWKIFLLYQLFDYYYSGCRI